MPEAPGNDTPKLKADIGLISALSIVVGMVLGAGAFMKPPAVMASASSRPDGCRWPPLFASSFPLRLSLCSTCGKATVTC